MRERRMIGEAQVLLWAMVRGARKPDKVKFDYWKEPPEIHTSLKGISHYEGTLGQVSIFNYLIGHNSKADAMDNVYFFRKPEKWLNEYVVDDMLLRLGIGVER